MITQSIRQPLHQAASAALTAALLLTAAQPATAQPGWVLSHQKISSTQGGFTGTLDDFDYFGASVASLGDLDGDGVGDLAVGTYPDDDGGTNRGAVWILFLNTDGTVKSHQKISDTQGGFTGNLDDSDRFGSGVASLGDLDGDGVTDLAVGAPGDDDGGGARGAVWILFLNPDGTVKSHQKISDTQGGFTGILDDIDNFGESVALLGDLDGDGVTDLAVGAIGDDDGASAAGAVWVLFLNTDGTVKSHQEISATQGGFTGTLDRGDHFGTSLAALGDLDGDGVTDLAVGAYGDDDGGGGRGAVWALFLNPDGTVKSHQKISSTEGDFTGILDNQDHFGRAVASPGDLDGDGVPDLAVGASQDGDGGNHRGAVWVLFLNPDGTVKSHRKISSTQGGFTGILDDHNLFGRSLASLGDLDGDGLTDLAVGAILDDDGGDRRGAVWILFLDGVGWPRGDMNCDGAFNGADIDPFFLALGDPAAYLAAFPECNIDNADMNCDQAVNGADIDRFFACLAGNNCQDCNANGIPDDCDGIGPLAIVTQPQSTVACIGDTVTLSVETSSFPLTVQWRKNGNPIAGATSMWLRFDPVQLSDAGDYDVIAGDACVSLTSDIATLTVHDSPPVIITQPLSQVVCLGAPLVLSVDATGPALTYQWRKDGTDIPGATDPIYIIPVVSESDAGVYDVSVANGCDTVRSDPASVTIPTTIIEHPAGQTVCENDPVFFTVGAAGAPLTYQWRKDGVNISGATLNFFIINAAAPSDAGIYDVVVTSSLCTQTSNPAPLVVQKCP